METSGRPCFERDVNRWKRSLSDTCLNESDGKRRHFEDRTSRSFEDIRKCLVPCRLPMIEPDDQTLLQIALDKISDLQRQLGASDSEDEEDDSGLALSPDTSTEDAEVVMAGYDYCSKEALKFLVQEEKLPVDHPVVRELSRHLARQKMTLDCSRVLATYNADDESYLGSDDLDHDL